MDASAEGRAPPRWGYLPTIVAPLLETVHIATLGTLVAVVLALPVAFLAARNTSANGFTWAIGRGILVGSRSINTVIWGLLFVAIFGPGAVAGVFAVAARSVGFIAKLVAEAIEDQCAGLEGHDAVGKGPRQRHVVDVDQRWRGTLGGQFADQPHDLARGLGVQARSGFVHQQQVGPLHQRPRNAHALALTT